MFANLGGGSVRKEAGLTRWELGHWVCHCQRGEHLTPSKGGGVKLNLRDCENGHFWELISV